jgi:hypothetical protein
MGDILLWSLAALLFTVQGFTNSLFGFVLRGLIPQVILLVSSHFSAPRAAEPFQALHGPLRCQAIIAPGAHLPDKKARLGFVWDFGLLQAGGAGPPNAVL